MKKKKVYIAYTGGTIGMKPSDKGFVPQEGFLENTLASFHEFKHPDMPEITIRDYAEPIDSANMTPQTIGSEYISSKLNLYSAPF